MDLGLTDKVAIVAASSKGIGKATAERLASEGVKVVICSRNNEALNTAAKDIQSKTGTEVLPVKCDVTDPGDIENLFVTTEKYLGQVDILVCNAGGPPQGTFETLSEKDFSWAIDLNLKSTINLSRRAMRGMKDRKWGRIIAITSISAKQPLDNLILSNTVRAGVMGFVKSLSNEVAQYNITINCVCPGYTTTDRLKDFAENLSKSGSLTVEQLFTSWEHSIPARRLARPDEPAGLIAFLASEPAGYITGTSIQIDGGYIKGLY
jgi:3-oxoacyl-[acyl-carrier protein] reductase